MRKRKTGSQLTQSAKKNNSNKRHPPLRPLQTRFRKHIPRHAKLGNLDRNRALGGHRQCQPTHAATSAITPRAVAIPLFFEDVFEDVHDGTHASARRRRQCSPRRRQRSRGA